MKRCNYPLLFVTSSHAGLNMRRPGAVVNTTAPGRCYVPYVRVSDSTESDTLITGSRLRTRVNW